MFVFFFFSSRRRHTRFALVTGVQTCALPIFGDFVLWLARRRPQLQIHVLMWNIGAVKLLGRGRAVLTSLRWARRRNITFKFDSAHPIGAAHHQKIVVIDDALAFCGGIDMTADRWDTSAHLDEDPRRRRPRSEEHTSELQ